MIQIKWENGQYKTEKKAYIQYDYGQEIQILGLEEDSHLMFQFVKSGQQYNSLGEFAEGVYTVKIPDEVLVESGPFGLYCFYENETEGHTEKLVVIDVLDREMYPPRDPEEYHDIIAQILDDIAALTYRLDHFELTPEQLAEVVAQVEAAIDLDDYYDKEEVNTLLADKADKTDIPDVSGLATKTEVSEGLATKADKTDTYTKQEVNNLIPDVSGFATKQEVTSGLADKADKSDTYTKQEVDNLIPDVSGFATKTELSNGLASKVDTSTYSTDMQAVSTALSGKASASDLQTLSGTVSQQGQDITALQNEVNGVNAVLNTILNI